MPVRQNAFSHESRNAAREARLKLAEEARIDAAYFHGVHRIPSTDPRLSPHLIAYYEKLKSEGETILVMKNREGVEIETPSVEQIERFCRHHNIKFLDHEFIPSDEILFKRDDPKDELPVDKHHPVVWYRATRLFEKPQLFVGNISPSDIKQGLLGDCWLMCSLAAIAEFPSLVKVILNHAFNCSLILVITCWFWCVGRIALWAKKIAQARRECTKCVFSKKESKKYANSMITFPVSKQAQALLAQFTPERMDLNFGLFY